MAQFDSTLPRGQVRLRTRIWRSCGGAQKTPGVTRNCPALLISHIIRYQPGRAPGICGSAIQNVSNRRTPELYRSGCRQIRRPLVACGGRPSFRVTRARALQKELQKEMAAGATTSVPAALRIAGAYRTRRPARQTVASRTQASSQDFSFVRAAGLSILPSRRLTM